MGTPEEVRELFETKIDGDSRILSETRPSVGDFAVSVIIAEPYKLESLSPETNPYLVITSTRNSAREIPSRKGPELLQAAVEDAVGQLIK